MSQVNYSPKETTVNDSNVSDLESKSRRSSFSSSPSSPRTCKSERSLAGSPFIDPGEASDEEYYKYCLPGKANNNNKTSNNNNKRAQLPGDHRQARLAVGSTKSKRHHHEPPPAVGAATGNHAKPLRSFLIDDILSYKPKKDASAKQNNASASSKSSTIVNNSSLSASQIVRPWDTESRSAWPGARGSGSQPLDVNSKHLRDFARPRSADDESFDGSEGSEDSESPASSTYHKSNNTISSPLDALFQMTSKTLEAINNTDKDRDGSADHLNLFNNRQPPKKKRKSRTAFTNHQIFELEKRFLYQKYLSPADRDELASTLGLTGAQVITWFQNRRAKLKRDMEELKKDMEATKVGAVVKTALDYTTALEYSMAMKPSDLSLHALHSVRKSPM